jgi:hypothetical protein
MNNNNNGGSMVSSGTTQMLSAFSLGNTINEVSSHQSIGGG